jgi:ABC-type proline/glycine betaine transport system permease subunit
MSENSVLRFSVISINRRSSLVLLLLYKILKKIHNTGTNFYTSDRQVQENQRTSSINRNDTKT